MCDKQELPKFMQELFLDLEKTENMTMRAGFETIGDKLFMVIHSDNAAEKFLLKEKLLSSYHEVKGLEGIASHIGSISFCLSDDIEVVRAFYEKKAVKGYKIEL